MSGVALMPCLSSSSRPRVRCCSDRSSVRPSIRSATGPPCRASFALKVLREGVPATCLAPPSLRAFYAASEPQHCSLTGRGCRRALKASESFRRLNCMYRCDKLEVLLYFIEELGIRCRQ